MNDKGKYIQSEIKCLWVCESFLFSGAHNGSVDVWDRKVREYVFLP